MIATTIEQGKRLLDAGLDPKTADMCYIEEIITNGIGCIPYKRTWSEYPCVDTHEESEGPELVSLPAWSLSKLWDIMLRSGVVYEYSTSESSKDVLDSLVDAVARLAKQGRIK